MAKRFWKGKKLGGEGELATSKAVACSASHLLGFRTGTPGLEGSVAGPHPGRSKGWVGGCAFRMRGPPWLQRLGRVQGLSQGGDAV